MIDYTLNLYKLNVTIQFLYGNFLFVKNYSAAEINDFFLCIGATKAITKITANTSITNATVFIFF